MLNAQQGSGTGRSMSPIDYAGSTGITAAVPQRVFLSHTSDLGRHTEPGSFVAAAVEAGPPPRPALTRPADFPPPRNPPGPGPRGRGGPADQDGGRHGARARFAA